MACGLLEDLIVRCVDCLFSDPDFLQDDGYCSVCGKPLTPKVEQEVPASITQQEPTPVVVTTCRLCGAPAGPDGGFCTTCELMVLGELEVQEPVTRVDVAEVAEGVPATPEPDQAPAPAELSVEPEQPPGDVNPPLELESWWVPSVPLAFAPPQEPPHEEPPPDERRSSAAAQWPDQTFVPATGPEPVTPEPAVESWIVPPPPELAALPAADPRGSDPPPAPWWAPAVATAEPPPMPPQERPASPPQNAIAVATAPVAPAPVAGARLAAPGGPTAGRVVRPSYSASTRPVPRGPGSATPARRQLRTRRPIQTTAIRQPFLVAALLVVTAGGSYATREWLAGRLAAGEPPPIQARPAYTAAMTTGPMVVMMPPPLVAQSRVAEALPPPASTTAHAPSTSPAPPASKTPAPAKVTTPTPNVAKTARKTVPPSRPTAQVKNDVRPPVAAPPVVAAMTAPPQGNLAPPVDAPPRAPEPVPEPLQKSQVFEISQVDVRPEVASRTEPNYPASARERGIEDVVVVRVLVSPSGKAADTQLLRRSKHDAAFDSAALSAVRQWTFTPARKRDRVVSCWMSVGIPFRMPRAEGSQ